MTPSDEGRAAGIDPRRLFVFNGGFLTQRRVRRILMLAGYQLRLGLPGPDDLVAIWGQSATAARGRAVAARRGCGLLHVEDAFLRSLHPGRSGEPPLGLHLDRAGVHFDAAIPSELETLLATHPLDDTALLDRARDAMGRMAEAQLSKYSATRTDLEPPAPGYVLVVDQTRGDASVRASGGDDDLFREMLVFAQEEHPGARVIVKTHPETAQGFRSGYFGAQHVSERVTLLDETISPWRLLEGAVGVYTVSSQLGFEAILAGHRPRVFGQPFYAGWGLTQDERPVPRRERRLTRAQLFAAAMILYPLWYDPHDDRLCELERVLDILEARARAWREDRAGWTASGMRLWKRPTLARAFGQGGGIRFTDTPPPADPRPRMAWAGKGTAGADVVRVEDGFLRSRGLGAELVPPQSLVLDDLGIYYDPTRPSRLEHWIARRETLTPRQRHRAEALIRTLSETGLSKYNTGAPPPALPPGHRVLVPGQVADDASILTGADRVRTSAELLQAARAARPDAVLIYKPHPDVEAGLREGELDGTADLVLRGVHPAALLDRVDEVWTITSLLGFEALLRDVKVTTFGAPFYAGWGLTTDLGRIPARRQARPDLAGLVHAVLIDYPRYFDPVTGEACPVEVAVARLAAGEAPRRGPVNRGLSKLQGLLASRASLWR